MVSIHAGAGWALQRAAANTTIMVIATSLTVGAILWDRARL